MKKVLVALLNDESGQSMVEYGVGIALVAIAAFTAFRTLGEKTTDQFKDLETSLGQYGAKSNQGSK